MNSMINISVFVVNEWNVFIVFIVLMKKLYRLVFILYFILRNKLFMFFVNVKKCDMVI